MKNFIFAAVIASLTFGIQAGVEETLEHAVKKGNATALKTYIQLSEHYRFLIPAASKAKLIELAKAEVAKQKENVEKLDTSVLSWVDTFLIIGGGLAVAGGLAQLYNAYQDKEQKGPEWKGWATFLVGLGTFVRSSSDLAKIIHTKDKAREALKKAESVLSKAEALPAAPAAQ